MRPLPAVNAQPNLASIHQYSIVHLSTKSNSEPTPSPIFYPCITGEDHCSSFTKSSAKRPLPISNESAPSPHWAPIKPENERVTLTHLRYWLDASCSLTLMLRVSRPYFLYCRKFTPFSNQPGLLTTLRKTFALPSLPPLPESPEPRSPRIVSCYWKS